MAALHIHMLLGAAVGIAAEATDGAPAAVGGHVAAAVSHVWLDDLNVGEMRWYHGYGSGWPRVIYIAVTVLLALGLVAALVIRPRAISYALAATWADWEHPVRWLLKEPDFLLHRLIAWEGFRRPIPGMVMWLVAGISLLLTLL